MRVLLVLGRSDGGVVRHVAELAAGLVLDGHSVLLAGPQSTRGQFAAAGLAERFVPVEIDQRPHPRRDLTARRKLAALRAGADVVHAHGVRAGALAALTRGDAPLVVTLHNAAPSDRLLALTYAGLVRLVARRAAVVLGVSTDLVDQARTLGARHTGLAVVPAPPPPTMRHPPSQTRRSLALPDGTSLMVTVGRLTEQKDLPTLLAAVKRLDDLAVMAVVVGDGPLREQLTARIAQERLPVRLLGRREDVPDLLAAADVVVSSARWEGQPLWLQEALQVGAPIVATDAGGTAATLRDAAILTPVGDYGALAEGVRQVLTDPACRADLVHRAVAAAASLPTAADAVVAAVSVYRDATRR